MCPRLTRTMKRMNYNRRLQVKTRKCISAALLAVSFAASAALASAESFASAALTGSQYAIVAFAYIVVFASAAYAFIAASYAVLLGLALLVGGVADLAKRAGSNS